MLCISFEVRGILYLLRENYNHSRLWCNFCLVMNIPSLFCQACTYAYTFVLLFIDYFSRSVCSDDIYISFLSVLSDAVSLSG